MIDPDELKAQIQREISQLQQELKAGTLDRRTLEAELKKLQQQLKQMPPYKPNV
jgi:uncharacterized protein involved in exopolysaccharide biosynthesis